MVFIAMGGIHVGMRLRSVQGCDVEGQGGDNVRETHVDVAIDLSLRYQ